MVSNCDGQKKEKQIGNTITSKNRIRHSIKKDTMEYFNKDQYKNLPTNDMGFYLLRNGDLVQVIDKTENHGYAERIHKKNSPFGYYKEYNKVNALKKTGEFFYMLNINIWKEYNESGKLIEEINYEEFYKFSIKDLIEKIKKDNHVDLEDMAEGGSVSRNGENGNIYYEVNLTSKKDPQKIDYILIDGVTGETKFKTYYYMKGNGTSPFDKYLESLRKK